MVKAIYKALFTDGLKLFQSWAQGIFPRMGKSAGIDKNDPIQFSAHRRRKHNFLRFFWRYTLYFNSQLIRALNKRDRLRQQCQSLVANVNVQSRAMTN